ncbi:MAG: NAD(P)-dependent glycerol-3-phosphate dehydrogenase [candidate division WOR-3 bacterium]|nr:MAG: NAD(P)-dependent glycerol-3-phosphate dehydrogenase [candidate division WOR-3 bacterium]
MKIGILGCGNWGSVFGIMQYDNGHEVRIWEYDKERCKEVRATRSNEPFLVGYKIPEEIEVHWDMEHVIRNVDLVVSAIPSQVIRSVVERMKECDLRNKYYLSLTKGIEINTLLRPSEIIGELQAATGKIYVLSGPCIANEIIRKEPTAVVIVGSETQGTHELQMALSTDYFRIYQSGDIVGVELGAAIKNVIAIGCGISDGLGFGTNAKGALITRAIVEMQRLGAQLGAREKTFWGLSGFGDLITTAFSEESRNHTLGKMIGSGKSYAEASREMIMVAEGAPTAEAVKKLSAHHCVDMPICEAVYNILYRQEKPVKAIGSLMRRPLKSE